MKVTLVSRSGREIVKGGIELGDSATVADLQEAIHKRIKKHPSRQRLTLPVQPGSKEKPVVLNYKKSLNDYTSGNSETLTVQFKDLGPQVSYRTLFFFEYLGPLLLYPIFYYYPAVYLIINHFNRIVAKVCENLLNHGALILDLVIRYTELSSEHAKNSLLVLIQHNWVQAFVTDGGDEDESRVKTQYMVLFDNMMHRLRFLKFMEIVSGELDDKCAKIFEGLLRDGRLNMKLMVDRESQGEENAAAVRESLLKFLMAQFF